MIRHIILNRKLRIYIQIIGYLRFNAYYDALCSETAPLNYPISNKYDGITLRIVKYAFIKAIK